MKFSKPIFLKSRGSTTHEQGSWAGGAQTYLLYQIDFYLFSFRRYQSFLHFQFKQFTLQFLFIGNKGPLPLLLSTYLVNYLYNLQFFKQTQKNDQSWTKKN